MNRNKWTRWLALGLVAACLIGVVAAAANDLNGDGKTNAWDLQVAINQGKTDTEKAAVLQAVLGGVDELRPNAEGVYEISSLIGIQVLMNHANEGASFRLVNDIDLTGVEWTPLAFSGNFDGNGHTISNVTIDQDVKNGNTYAMGFFSTVYQYTKNGETTQSVVENLHLENVNLTATENSQYMGLLAGTNKGVVRNCTATGSVTDNRTDLPKNVYIGALVGCNENTTIPGRVEKGSDLLTATAGTGQSDDKVEGISAKMAAFCAELREEETDKRYVGMVGYSKTANMPADMLWQDTSNSTQYKSAAEQARRNTVEQEMYKMGTVQWTPSETITFTRFGNSKLSHSNAFVAGRTYTGIPYVGARNGSYARFMSQMQETKDSQGRYVTVTGLQDGDQSETYTYDGFVTMMGNNCYWAVIWSWATVSPNRTENGYGGVAVNDLNQMIPTAANITERGALPVGGYTVADGMDADAEATQKIIAENGVTVMAECYAQAGKGDAIVFRGITLGGNEDGHTRMLSQDPVIIRKGTALTAGSTTTNAIDLDRSYIQFHGQGDGLSRETSGDTYTDGQGRTFKIKYTSWELDHKVTLNALLTKEGAQAAADGGYWGFIPVTINAFSAPASFEKDKTPYYNLSGSNAVTMPNSGKYYSNYKTVGATMVIRDAAGNMVYEKSGYAVSENTTPNIFYDTLDLSQLFPDADEALTAGETYTATLKFITANGTQTVPYVDKAKTVRFENYEFTYNG